MEKKLITMLVLFGVAAILLSGCLKTDTNFKEPQRFESYSQMIAAFEESRDVWYGMDEALRGGIVPMMQTGIAESADGGGKSNDFSQTNVQVEGVDEADIVKTDGKYIYNFSNSNLIITDAYPIENSQILSTTELDQIYPLEMFVNDDTLLLFGNKRSSYVDEGEIYQETSEMAIDSMWWGGSFSTVVQIYDISDRSNPVVEKELEFEGSYITSRLIGKNAYFVVNSWPVYNILDDNTADNIIPRMTENGVKKRIAEATEIAYLPPMPAETFVTLASINLDSGELQKETIAGSAQSVYASQNNIYLAATSWLPPDTPVIAPIERVITGDQEKTIINKFGLVDGEIGFIGQGNVPGHVLNQFSMDEFEENFRIATTSGHVSRSGSESRNNLYVLDAEMNLIGSLEDLAPGEKIYSARFMGEKAYMVTFKKVDPLFVIDVSNPRNPTVLGKLKIPGYSDYLHPIDDTHIIGIGKDTIESNYGDFAWYQGMKLAVFDVSDVENPIEMHKIIIGDRGTDSYALHDHKAFLYDAEKELLVLPIMLAEIADKSANPESDQGMSPSYGESVFQGAFVFKLTLENGFEERGRITHVSEEDELKRGYYYGDEYSVKRSLYISDVLYTLSNKMLKANSLSTLEELKEFSFE